MKFRASFMAGFATGYVLGARAGRERYEQIMSTARRVADTPAVQEAAGVLQAQASGFADTAKNKVGELSGKVRPHDKAGEPSLSTPATPGSPRTTSSTSGLADERTPVKTPSSGETFRAS